MLSYLDNSHKTLKNNKQIFFTKTQFYSDYKRPDQTSFVKYKYYKKTKLKNLSIVSTSLIIIM